MIATHIQTRRRRSGYTLMELSVAIPAAIFLFAGLAGALYLSVLAADEASSEHVEQVEANEALDRMNSDLNYATGFYQRTPTTVAFDVPDRSGNELDNRIEYSWSGVPGDPLVMIRDGGNPAPIVDSVESFEIEYKTRTVTGTGFAQGVTSSGLIVYEGFTEDNGNNNSVSSITLTNPAGTAAGDLLVAVVVLSEKNETITPPACWTSVMHQTDKKELTMGVWWKIAAAGEPSGHIFAMSESDETYAWKMRFTGHHASDPINMVAVETGNSKTPTSPPVTTTVDGALIVRLGGFNGNNVTVDSPGLSGHEPITADGSSNQVSGAAGYLAQASAGATGLPKFSLTKKSRYINVTIAIAPE